MESTDTRSLFYTVNSAINTNYFPRNNPVRFTNIVPYTITQREPKKFYIRLHTINISKQIQVGSTEEDLKYSGYAKIFINEIEPNSINSSYDKCIGKFNYISARKHEQNPVDYLVHEFKEAPFLELLAIPLPQLSISITDSGNKPLKLDLNGPPTIIDFELIEMDLTGKFTMTFMSHGMDELRIFPNNTLTSFQVKCPQEIRLRKWEVALASIGFPPDILSDTKVWWTVKEERENAEEKKFEFDLLDYPNTEKFLDDVKQSLADDIEFGDKVMMMRTSDVESAEYGYVNFVSSGTLEYNLEVSFSHGFSKAMGQHEIQPPGRITNDLYITFQGLPSITLALPPSVALLACSIVQSSAVGHELSPLLRTVPVNIAKGNYLYEPKHLIYHPVINRSFTDIAFVLRRPDGLEHDLHSRREHLEANGGIVMTLIFRPRQGESKLRDCETVGVANCY